MNAFIEFLEAYWKIIAIVVVVILEIILLIVKSKTKTVAVSNLDILIPLINEAEKNCSSGREKIIYVLTHYYELYPESNVPSFFLMKEIEQILSTPTKKGGCGREQDN